ncbi:hypothetical protein KQH62_04770 [bacterium]|nr:hypothetical protein [bacterium]
MNQIAIGDGTSTGGWLMLAGEGVAAPFKKAVYEQSTESGDRVGESLRLSLEGTPEVLSDALAALETVRQRAILFEQGTTPQPQSLRFQPLPGDAYAYAQVRDLVLAANPDSPETRLSGSLLVDLHFSRPNYFDSDWVELPLTGADVEDVLGGIDLVNHTDIHTGHGSSAWARPADIESALPAPLRVELTNTTAAGRLHDVYLGLCHHPEQPPEDLFFRYGADFEGGAVFTNAAAINGYFARVAWAATGWTPLGSWLLSGAEVGQFGGGSYRPVLRLYNPHSYGDLQLRLKLQISTDVLWEGEPVFADPNYGYVLFPPVQIPPGRLLNEGPPHHVDLVLYGQHDTSVTHTLDFDCLTPLPLDPGANFIAFHDLSQDATLVDDNCRGVQVTRFDPSGLESPTHIRQGRELLLWPGHFNRLVVVMTDGDGQVDIFRTARLRLFYRQRRRVL